MQLLAELAQLPNAVKVEPISGMEDAFTLSYGWFRHGIALNGDGGCTLQVNAKNTVPVEYLRVVLSFAQEHSSELLGSSPVSYMDGFRFPSTTFEGIVSMVPSVARRLDMWVPSLAARTYAVIPGWRCETSGDEDEVEARARLSRGFGIELDRAPTPFVRLSYKIGDGGGTVGSERIIGEASELYSIIQALTGESRGYVEYENFQHRVGRIEWTPSGPERVTEARREPMQQGEILQEVQAFLTGL